MYRYGDKTAKTIHERQSNMMASKAGNYELTVPAHEERQTPDWLTRGRRNLLKKLAAFGFKITRITEVRREPRGGVFYEERPP
jgi:ribosomal protein S11